MSLLKQVEDDSWLDQLQDEAPTVYDPDLTPEADAWREKEREQDQRLNAKETAFLIKEAQRRIQAGDIGRELRPINQDKSWGEYRKKQESADPLALFAMLDRWITLALPITLVLESQSDARLENKLDEKAEWLKASRNQLLSIQYPKPTQFFITYADEVSREVRDVYIEPEEAECLEPTRVHRAFGSFFTNQTIRILTD